MRRPSGGLLCVSALGEAVVETEDRVGWKEEKREVWRDVQSVLT